jgi:UDP:flavonoid glycosyltransferase YjiC (YdhE family)
LKKTCPQADPPKWLIYALGGGWGHLTRAAALARNASQCSVRILTNSPFAAQVQCALPNIDLVILDPALPVPIAREQARKYVQAAAPACLIVDTFPRGLGGELTGLLDSLQAAKVLVHRDLSPRYVAEANLRDFVSSAYDLILIPGEWEGRAFAKLPDAVVTEPWLIRNADELLPPGRARQLLKIADHRQPCILVCASGTAQELSWFGAVISELLKRNPRAAIRCVAPACPSGCPSQWWIKYWPAADLFPATDVVIGGAGYNTVYECLAYNVPLVARPWPRLYDRQRLRARRAAQRGTLIMVDQPGQAASAAIHQLNRRSHHGETHFCNGALVAHAHLRTRFS